MFSCLDSRREHWRLVVLEYLAEDRDHIRRDIRYRYQLVFGRAELPAAFRMNWLAEADAGAFSHIWVGGWSFLLLRSWMYRAFELLALLAGLGLLKYSARGRSHHRPRRPRESAR